MQIFFYTLQLPVAFCHLPVAWVVRLLLMVINSQLQSFPQLRVAITWFHQWVVVRWFQARWCLHRDLLTPIILTLTWAWSLVWWWLFNCWIYDGIAAPATKAAHLWTSTILTSLAQLSLQMLDTFSMIETFWMSDDAVLCLLDYFYINLYCYCSLSVLSSSS